MIKYAFYILIGIFFVLGLNIAPGQELSGLQNEIEVRVGDTPQFVFYLPEQIMIVSEIRILYFMMNHLIIRFVTGFFPASPVQGMWHRLNY